MAPPSEFEAPHVILPTTSHTHTIIALHGRGSQGPEFAEEIFEGMTSTGLDLRDCLPSCKWVFPSSQERYSTVFQEEMDEWFDIYSLTDPAKREELQVEGIRDSIDFLRKLVMDEAQLVTHNRVILLGLSQGCAIGVLTMLAMRYKLGAFIGLNGWMPFRAQLEEAVQSEPHFRIESRLKESYQSNFGIASVKPTSVPQARSFNGIDMSIPAAAQSSIDTTWSTSFSSSDGSMRRSSSELTSSVLETPVFLGHTLDDEVVDVELGREIHSTLSKMDMKVKWTEMKDGGHLGYLDTDGLDMIAEFLGQLIVDS